MDDRRALPPYMIQRELEALADLPRDMTRLHCSISEHDVWMLWQVYNRYIRLGPVPVDDLHLSLEAFSAKHCVPAVKVMVDGMYA